MVEGSIIIKNETGLHARPASEFILFTNKFEEDIKLIKEDKIANGKSILNVLTLCLKKGSEVTIQVTGKNEVTVLKQVMEFLDQLKG